MADGGRSSGRAPPRGGREGLSVYQNSSDRSPRGLRTSISPRRGHLRNSGSRSPDRGRDNRGRRYVSQRHDDNQYGIPGENNYRPRYASPPGAYRSNSTRAPSSHASTSNIRPDRLPLAMAAGSPHTSASVNQKSTTPDKSTVVRQQGEETVKELGLLFQRIIEEATELSTLKMRQSVAQRQFDSRVDDYKRSEAIHEKFPPTAEIQTRNRDRAERGLKAITEEVEAKKSALTELAVKSASRFIPDMIAATSDCGHSQLQVRIDELEKKCTAFAKKFEEQHSFIERLQKSHEEKFKAQEDKWKGAQSFSMEIQPQLASILEKSMKTDIAVGSLKKEIGEAKETTARLSEQIPPNLKLKLEKLSSLSDHVDTFPNLRLDIEKIRQESGTSTKDLAKHIKNIERLGTHYDKLEKLDLVVQGTVTELAALKARKTSQAPAFPDKHPETTTLEIRLNRLENEMKAKTFTGSLSKLKDTTPSLNTRLRAAQDQKPPTPSPETGSSTLARISSLENKIVPALNKSISQVSDRCGILSGDLMAVKVKLSSLEQKGNDLANLVDEKMAKPGMPKVQEKSDINSPPKIDFDTLKIEVLEIVEEKQAAVDRVIDGIATQIRNGIKDTQNRCTALEQNFSEMKSTMKTTYDLIVDFPPKAEELKASLDQRIRQHLDQVVNKVLDLIRVHPEIVSPAVIETQVSRGIDSKLELITKKYQSLIQSVNERLDANSEGLINLDRRFNNITTKSMAVYILSQMETLYPDLRNVQNMLVELTASRRRDEATLQSLVTSTSRIQNQVNNLDSRPQSTSDEKSLHALRSDVETLTAHMADIETLTAHIAELDGAVNTAQIAADKANDGITAIHKLHGQYQNDMIEVTGKLRVDMEEIRDQGQYEPISTHAAAPFANRPSVFSPARSISTGITGRPTAGASSQRLASLHSDQGYKKRKLNGSLSSTSTSQSAKGPNNSHSVSKKRRKFGEFGDDSEDSNFEPNQPSLSDDPDES